ncbi:MAG: hypothetical protein SCH71_05350 [Desulfobulbaceae bacterium]|nr:hypothetical protein [Desulfobulbaceae bacterium]
MESLKEFMGFLLVATVIWLLWILGIQAGPDAVILVLSALLITALGGWIYGRWGNLAMPKNKRIAAAATALVLIFGANIYALTNVMHMLYNKSPFRMQTALNGNRIQRKALPGRNSKGSPCLSILPLPGV